MFPNLLDIGQSSSNLPSHSALDDALLNFDEDEEGDQNLECCDKDLEAMSLLARELKCKDGPAQKDHY
jgi:hypothetical protein